MGKERQGIHPVRIHAAVPLISVGTLQGIAKRYPARPGSAGAFLAAGKSP